MARHAIIDPKTNRVINVVIWNGAEWLPPRNHIVLQHDSVDIDDIYDPSTGSIIKIDRTAKESYE